MLENHAAQLSAALEALKNKKNINHFYFVACGGSKAFFGPAEYIFDQETEIPASVYSANEFNHRLPKALNENSVVITCSHSGNTPETVRASQIGREKGALTICFSNVVDSPLWKAADYPVYYCHTKDEAPEENGSYMLYNLLFGILNILSPKDKYARAINCIPALSSIYEKNIALYAERATKFGETMKREPLIYTMASGSNYSVAYSFAVCLLMEMQWVNSSAIHSGEYFHGPFEVTDFDVPFIIIKGIDECRPLDERAYNFCEKYSQKVFLIDCAEFDMEGIDEDLRGYFATLVADKVLKNYATELADKRGHKLDVRRYMWRMEY